ncbi:hypothetical protein SO802_008918 [Lithocarpus litseifolius]|uniref:Uncharacterized protein n=1 Tax=Lithocarpus litseifolius TaxID=425828 RepID=A0AAW2DFK2_9ROSI
MDMKDFIPLAWLEMFVISGAFLWEWVESGFLDPADCCFMDKTVPGKEVPDEVTRESLISISYSEPDKVPTSKLSSEKLNSENHLGRVDSNGNEKYRSELISISYTQSPETGGLPVSLSPGELKD